MSTPEQTPFERMYLLCLKTHHRPDLSVKEWAETSRAVALELLQIGGTPVGASVAGGAAAPGAPPEEAAATVFGPAFRGWPAAELERVLLAAQHYALGREMNASEDQFEDAKADLVARCEELATKRIAMKG